MKRALFAGSFDPPTKGHEDLIQRAAVLFETLYVAVASNTSKKTRISVQERMRLLQKICSHHANVTVLCIDGLVSAFAKEHSVDVLLRGVRGPLDADVEMAIAQSNRDLNGLETIFLTTSGSYAHIRSTIVREIAQNGGDVYSFVPGLIIEEVKKLYG